MQTGDHTRNPVAPSPQSEPKPEAERHAAPDIDVSKDLEAARETPEQQMSPEEFQQKLDLLVERAKERGNAFERERKAIDAQLDAVRESAFFVDQPASELVRYDQIAEEARQRLQKVEERVDATRKVHIKEPTFGLDAFARDLQAIADRFGSGALAPKAAREELARYYYGVVSRQEFPDDATAEAAERMKRELSERIRAAESGRTPTVSPEQRAPDVESDRVAALRQQLHDLAAERDRALDRASGNVPERQRIGAAFRGRINELQRQLEAARRGGEEIMEMGDADILGPADDEPVVAPPLERGVVPRDLMDDGEVSVVEAKTDVAKSVDRDDIPMEEPVWIDTGEKASEAKTVASETAHVDDIPMEEAVWADTGEKASEAKTDVARVPEPKTEGAAVAVPTTEVVEPVTTVAAVDAAEPKTTVVPALEFAAGDRAGRLTEMASRTASIAQEVAKLERQRDTNAALVRGSVREQVEQDFNTKIAALREEGDVWTALAERVRPIQEAVAKLEQQKEANLRLVRGALGEQVAKDWDAKLAPLQQELDHALGLTPAEAPRSLEETPEPTEAAEPVTTAAAVERTSDEEVTFANFTAVEGVAASDGTEGSKGGVPEASEAKTDVVEAATDAGAESATEAAATVVATAEGSGPSARFVLNVTKLEEGGIARPDAERLARLAEAKGVEAESGELLSAMLRFLAVSTPEQGAAQAEVRKRLAEHLQLPEDRVQAVVASLGQSVLDRARLEAEQAAGGWKTVAKKGVLYGGLAVGGYLARTVAGFARPVTGLALGVLRAGDVWRTELAKAQDSEARAQQFHEQLANGEGASAEFRTQLARMLAHERQRQINGTGDPTDPEAARTDALDYLAKVEGLTAEQREQIARGVSGLVAEDAKLSALSEKIQTEKPTVYARFMRGMDQFFEGKAFQENRLARWTIGGVSRVLRGGTTRGERALTPIIFATAGAFLAEQAVVGRVFSGLAGLKVGEVAGKIHAAKRFESLAVVRADAIVPGDTPREVVERATLQLADPEFLTTHNTAEQQALREAIDTWRANAAIAVIEKGTATLEEAWDKRQRDKGRRAALVNAYRAAGAAAGAALIPEATKWIAEQFAGTPTAAAAVDAPSGESVAPPAEVGATAGTSGDAAAPDVAPSVPEVPPPSVPEVDPTVAKLATVGSGEGVTTAIARQVLARGDAGHPAVNADEIFKLDQTKLPRWAVLEAKRIAIESGFIDEASDKEVWVTEPGAQYVIGPDGQVAHQAVGEQVHDITWNRSPEEVAAAAERQAFAASGLEEAGRAERLWLQAEIALAKGDTAAAYEIIQHADHHADQAQKLIEASGGIAEERDPTTVGALRSDAVSITELKNDLGVRTGDLVRFGDRVGFPKDIWATVRERSVQQFFDDLYMGKIRMPEEMRKTLLAGMKQQLLDYAQTNQRTEMAQDLATPKRWGDILFRADSPYRKLLSNMNFGRFVERQFRS